MGLLGFARVMMLAGRRLSVLGLLAGTLGLPAYAAPADLLARALKGPTKPYEGVQETTVYSTTGASLSRVRVRGDGRSAVRREFETGPAAGIVVIQKGARTWQKQGDGSYLQLPVTGSDPTDMARRVAANYRVTVRTGLEFLGRRASEVQVAARHPFNPSRKLVIDDATGLILEDVLFTPDGQKRSHTAFVSLTYRPQPPSVFDVPRTTVGTSSTYGPGSFEARDSEEQVAKETGRPVPVPRYVPPGYLPCVYGVMTTGRGIKTPAVRYSDGLAAITIFVRAGGVGMGGGPGMGGGWRRGAGGQGPRRRGPGPWGPPGRPGDLTTESDRQRSVVLYTSTTASYILIGDISVDELTRVARSLP